MDDWTGETRKAAAVNLRKIADQLESAHWVRGTLDLRMGIREIVGTVHDTYRSFAPDDEVTVTADFTFKKHGAV